MEFNAMKNNSGVTDLPDTGWDLLFRPTIVQLEEPPSFPAEIPLNMI